MIGISTNRPDFFNDISEEIRLFLGLTEIRLLEEGEDEANLVAIRLTKESGEWIACGNIRWEDGRTAVYSCRVCAGGASALEEKRYAKRAVKITAFRLMRQLFDAYVPWGSLTGIRPTKLTRDLIAAEGYEQAVTMMQRDFDVRADKRSLVLNTVRVQRPILESAPENGLDVYVGIPFCKSRCLYCSFASEVLNAKSDTLTPYLAVLHRDIELGAQLAREGGYAVRCLYIGGGTPTVLSAGQMDVLLTHIQKQYGDFEEITVEAGRPDTLDEEKLRILKAHGVERISINPQTMNDDTLERIGRRHTAGEIVRIYEIARRIGFSCINMDIIAGLPGEGLPEFSHTIAEVETLQPDNLTVHTLAIKRSSRLKEHLAQYAPAAPAVVDEMLQLAFACTQRLHLEPYYMYRQKYMSGNLENVGYAAAGKACIYNVDMMEETVNILSHGAGAMTKRVFGGENRVERIPAPKNIPTYEEKLALLHQKKRMLFCGC